MRRCVQKVTSKRDKGHLVLAFILLTVLVLFGGCTTATDNSFTGGATLEDVNLSVSMVDEQSLRQRAIRDESGVVTCEFVGAFPGQFSVTIHGKVDDESRYSRSDSYEIAATIGENTDTSMTGVTVEDGGSEDFFKILGVDDNGSTEPGDNVTVTIALEQEGDTVDSVTRTVTVKERELDCEDG